MAEFVQSELFAILETGNGIWLDRRHGPFDWRGGPASAEARRWLGYAEENRRAAQLCLQANLFNPCLQNAQQAVEKALKAMHLGSGLSLKKTHSIGELRRDLLRAQVDPGLTADAADLLDTIYLPSK